MPSSGHRPGATRPKPQPEASSCRSSEPTRRIRTGCPISTSPTLIPLATLSGVLFLPSSVGRRRLLLNSRFRSASNSPNKSDCGTNSRRVGGLLHRQDGRTAAFGPHRLTDLLDGDGVRLDARNLTDLRDRPGRALDGALRAGGPAPRAASAATPAMAPNVLGLNSDVGAPLERRGKWRGPIGSCGSVGRERRDSHARMMRRVTACA